MYEEEYTTNTVKDENNCKIKSHEEKVESKSY